MMMIAEILAVGIEVYLHAEIETILETAIVVIVTIVEMTVTVVTAMIDEAVTIVEMSAAMIVVIVVVMIATTVEMTMMIEWMIEMTEKVVKSLKTLAADPSDDLSRVLLSVLQSKTHLVQFLHADDELDAQYNFFVINGATVVVLSCCLLCFFYTCTAALLETGVYNWGMGLPLKLPYCRIPNLNMSPA
jgi:flagellar biosynthesis protein FliQ